MLARSDKFIVVCSAAVAVSVSWGKRKTVTAYAHYFNSVHMLWQFFSFYIFKYKIIYLEGKENENYLNVTKKAETF